MQYSSQHFTENLIKISLESHYQGHPQDRAKVTWILRSPDWIIVLYMMYITVMEISWDYPRVTIMARWLYYWGDHNGKVTVLLGWP